MSLSPLDRLAEAALEAYADFDQALHGARKFPRRKFDAFFNRVVEYVEELKDRDLVDRQLASTLSTLREYLRLEVFNAPGEILDRADRLHALFFTGHDPHFEGDEPPGL